jgi:hypothetical protein
MIKSIKKINEIFNNIKYKRNKIYCYIKPRKIAWAGVMIPKQLNDICPICLEGGKLEVYFPCKHWLHEKCINKLFDYTYKCPICRYQLEGYNK